MVVSLDDVIDKTLSAILSKGSTKFTSEIREATLTSLCQNVGAVFMSQSTLLELEPPLIVCGDIHGQFVDLLRIFNRLGYPPHANYLFLGDYVDRGKFNMETITLLFAYKIKYPNNFFLLRGNHECSAINQVYGFYDECSRRYSVKLWNTFQDPFNRMPYCALVGSKILCMHGGISPWMTSFSAIKQLVRPLEPCSIGLALDILWSDPCSLTSGFSPNFRGVSYLFGSDALKRVCTTLNVDLVARGHQVVQDGYEFFADRKLVTIFSAPNYCGEFDNSAAVMRVDETLQCSFEVFKSTEMNIYVVNSGTLPS
uniref:Serine/threonine-protein phosphatase n=1 Tax=Bursaphelenchus xylophilus TaxID=6326 RepID=A0A1I7RS93_BURXY